jgi:hypothetical protein
MASRMKLFRLRGVRKYYERSAAGAYPGLWGDGLRRKVILRLLADYDTKAPANGFATVPKIGDFDRDAADVCVNFWSSSIATL